MQNRVHGFHHVSNNTLPQSNTARILIKIINITSSDIKAIGYGTFKLNHSKPGFMRHVPWNSPLKLGGFMVHY